MEPLTQSNQQSPPHPHQCGTLPLGAHSGLCLLLKNKFPFYMYGCFACMYVSCTVCMPDTHGGQKGGVISPGTGVIVSCEIPCGCLDPLEEQQCS